MQASWHSPAVALRIEHSRQRAALLWLLAATDCVCLWLTYLSNTPELTVPLVLFFSLQLRALWRQPHCGSTLCWRDGLWSIQRGDTRVALTGMRAGPCLPWVSCAQWCEQGRLQRLVLFHDACDAQALRRLRQRLLIAPD